MRKRRSLKAFGDYLRQLRDQANLSQGQVLTRLAKQNIAASGAALSRYESGERSPDAVVLYGLSKLYRTGIECLVVVLHANQNQPALSAKDVEQLLRSVRSQRDDDTAAAHRLAAVQDRLQSIAGELIELAAPGDVAGRRPPETRTRAAGHREESPTDR